MNLPNEHWRFTYVNENHQAIPSYPNLLVVPVAFSDSDLEKVKAFRTRKRIPICTWKHPRSDAVIARYLSTFFENPTKA